jgi:hypothetical protein
MKGAREFREFEVVEGGLAPTEWFGAWFRVRLDRVLRASTTRIVLAVDPSERTVLFGFCAVNRTRSGMLYWYVKQAFRRLGIGRAMLDEALPGWGPGLRTGYLPESMQPRLPGYCRDGRGRLSIYDPSVWEA